MSELPANRVQVNPEKIFEDKESQGEKVLGVYWDTILDCISYKLNFNRLPDAVRTNARPPTMREMLSFVMSIYDPMGLISNLKIHGKILMQK